MNITPQQVYLLTESHLKLLLLSRITGKQEQFVYPELLGTVWEEPLVPFYGLFSASANPDHSAKIAMGKLFKKVAVELGFKPHVGVRRGTKRITFYRHSSWKNAGVLQHGGSIVNNKAMMRCAV